jgi:hypothetical protein
MIRRLPAAVVAVVAIAFFYFGFDALIGVVRSGFVYQSPTWLLTLGISIYSLSTAIGLLLRKKWSRVMALISIWFSIILDGWMTAVSVLAYFQGKMSPAAMRGMGIEAFWLLLSTVLLCLVNSAKFKNEFQAYK